MSDLANVNSPADSGQAPSAPEAEVYPVRMVTRPRPVIIDKSASSERLEPLAGVPRAAFMDIAYSERPWHWYPANTGDHGVILQQAPAPGLEGGQAAWSNYNPRTFRQAPTVPWDEGSQIG